VDALPKIIIAMNMFVKQDIKMSAAMKAFNTNLRLPAQLLFDIFEKSTAYVDRTDRDKPAETRQVRPGRDELCKVTNAESFIFVKEGYAVKEGQIHRTRPDIFRQCIKSRFSMRHPI